MSQHPLTKVQELELISSLESHGEVPFKFSYLGDGHKNWESQAKVGRTEQGVQNNQAQLMKGILPYLFRNYTSKKITQLNIVDLGCGDGTPMLPIFTYLKEQGILDSKEIKYVPVDISEEMIDVAMQTVTKEFDVPVRSHILDFEKGSFSEVLLSDRSDIGEHSATICFFLGNTLGNFSDPKRVLTNLRDSMLSSDILVIANQIANLHTIDQQLAYYKNPTSTNLGAFIVKEYGYEPKEEEFVVKWNEELRQIECFLKFQEDTAFSILEKKIPFEKGEELLLFRSRKYTEEDLIALVTKVGFRVDFFISDPEKKYSLLCVNHLNYKA